MNTENNTENFPQRLVRATVQFCKDQWFDRSRNVLTCGEVLLPDAGIRTEDLQDSERYQPARPGYTRRALREIPVKDLSSFSYIDLGSGKGRTLFIAAEFPFQQIIGVEFSRPLHDAACANIRRFRWRKQRCGSIQSLHENAKDFVFPESNLVLYLFNPFGFETLQQVLDNLAASLKLHPRHVIVVLMRPRPGGAEQVASLEGMHLRRTNKRYLIFELPAPASA